MIAHVLLVNHNIYVLPAKVQESYMNLHVSKPVLKWDTMPKVDSVNHVNLNVKLATMETLVQFAKEQNTYTKDHVSVNVAAIITPPKEFAKIVQMSAKVV